jgi:hypothetical protein
MYMIWAPTVVGSISFFPPTCPNAESETRLRLQNRRSRATYRIFDGDRVGDGHEMSESMSVSIDLAESTGNAYPLTP